MRGVGGDPVVLAVLVGEHQHRASRPFVVAVEFDVVLDLDEPLRQRAVVMSDTAVDVINCAIGGFDDPRLDCAVFEAGVEPQPEVDLVGDTHAECAVPAAVEVVDADALTVDLHPTGPPARFLHVIHVGQHLAVLVAHLHRQQLPHRRGGFVVELPLDAGPVGFDVKPPLFQWLDAGPAHRPGAQVATVITGHRPAGQQIPVPAVGEADLDVAQPGSGVRVVAVAAGQQHRAVRRRGEEVAAIRPRGIGIVHLVESRRKLVSE